MIGKARMGMLAAMLAVIPTIGSQGVGTLAPASGHVDAALIGAASPAGAALLARADAIALRLARG